MMTQLQTNNKKPIAQIYNAALCADIVRLQPGKNELKVRQKGLNMSKP